jgi:DNA-binding transcriptional ArsR family regulator
MGISKTELFDEQTNNVANIYKALAHPARVTIIQILSISPKSNGDLVEALGLTQSTVSDHLRILKDAGFVYPTSFGSSMVYSINRAAWQQMKIDIQEFTVLM